MTEDYRAVTLGDAYNVCDPRPLEGDDVKKYYYDLSQVRNTEAINGVRFRLKSSKAEQNQTILFAGHRGGGKTTELRRLETELKQEYFIIYFSADEELDINDVSYTDLYLVIIKQVEQQLREHKISLDQKLLESFGDWFKEIIEETEKTVDISGSSEAGGQLGNDFPIPLLAKLWIKSLAQIKGSNKRKKIIREKLEKDVSRLKADINALLRDGATKLREKYPQYKGILIIVDDLDRIPVNVGDHLFFDYAAQLQELDCKIIYTVPISVVYSPKNVGNLFGQNPYVLPMVNIYQYNPNDQVEYNKIDLDINQDYLQAMANIIEKRINTDMLFEKKEDLLQIAKASGGHVRQLMRIMNTTCVTAVLVVMVKLRVMM